MKEKITKILKNIAKGILTILIILIVLILAGYIWESYKQNIKYSIAMPQIVGEFDYTKETNYVSVYGIEKMINDDIASLNINSTKCFLDKEYYTCDEKRILITGLGNSVMLVPSYYEYQIKYADENKIIFSNNGYTTGEIDLNSKTLVYTIKNAGFNQNETTKIEVLTNDEEIEKLEKKIIRKYLKHKMFK